MQFENAIIAKIDYDNGYRVQLETEEKCIINNIQLLSLLGISSKPQIGDEVKLFTNPMDSADEKGFAICFNPSLEPEIDNEGNFAIGNFFTKCFLKFFGNTIATSDATEEIKIMPTTKLTMGVGINIIQIDSTGVKIGTGAGFVLNSLAQITAPPGGGQCTITSAGQTILKA